MAVVILAAALMMVTVEVSATATEVTLLAASGGSNGGNGTTTNLCNAFLLRYADIINVGSNDNGNCACTINGGNIDEGVANLTMACGACGG